MNRRPCASHAPPPCAWLERCLLAALEAAPEETAAVREHLERCGTCREARADADRILGALRSLPRPDAPDLAPAVLARLPRHSASCFPHALRLRISRAAGLLLAAGALALALLRPRRPEAPDALDEAVNLAATRPPAAAQSVSDGARRNALDWLASTQLPDGSWDVHALGGRPEHAPALAALALLALQNGGAPGREEVLRRGAGALLARQRPSGAFGPDGSFLMYNHGMATVALLQLHPVCGTPAWRPALDAAIAFIRDAQQPAGGWGYRPGADGGPANASVSAWQLDALGRARQQGWDDRDGHLRRGLFWLSTLADGQGLVGYHQAGDLPSSRITTTALGFYCLARAGEGLAGTRPVMHAMARSLKRLVETQPWASDPNPYRDYFVARAVQAWSVGAPDPAPPDLAPMRHSLKADRIASGPSRGIWEPRDAYARVGGWIYSTSLSALALHPGR